MGQKTHPTGFRIGIIKPWLSSWYAKKSEYPEFLAEDAKIRKYVKKKLYAAGISRILIARKSQNVIITVVAAKPGIIVGRGGQGIDELRNDVSKLINKRVQIDIVEVAKIDADAQLVSEAIAQQLEKRVAFRRAMKMAMQRTMRAGVEGIKVAVSGRLGGAEIARTEWAKEGRIPLQTLRADIDYGFAQADTTMGIIGVKVWVFKSIILPGERADENIKAKSSHNNAPAGAADREERAKRRSRAPRKSE
ncbi:MAG: 30S ribosomal protein S3 [Candidatus Gastranaerophilales bacterium]|nr:30S ribosomal protein S3 [Candidatus Gastranaerophilales bacterium]